MKWKTTIKDLLSILNKDTTTIKSDKWSEMKTDCRTGQYASILRATHMSFIQNKASFKWSFL